MAIWSRVCVNASTFLYPAGTFLFHSVLFDAIVPKHKRVGLHGMAKKITKQPPHLRIRIEPKLIARLEKARQANGKTLTGEIADRLEESFDTEDKIALVKEPLEKRVAYLEEQLNLASQVHQRDMDLLHDRAVAIDATAKIFDALVGDDSPTKIATRHLALLFASNPRWHENQELVSRIARAASDTVISASGVKSAKAEGK
jgi:hypothetical protein